MQCVGTLALNSLSPPPIVLSSLNLILPLPPTLRSESFPQPHDRVAHVVGMTSTAMRKVEDSATSPQCKTVASSPTPPVFDHFTVGTIRGFVHAKCDLGDDGVAAPVQHGIPLEHIAAEGVCYEGIPGNRVPPDRHSPEPAAPPGRREAGGGWERFVVVAAGTAGGLFEGSFLCYTAKNTSDECHGEMTGEFFLRWLTTQLLTSLTEPSVLVLDSASYHSQLIEKSRPPTTATKKAYLIS
ncbi:hypothetical protein O3P69_020848 [Scylla paramamosain]|uniref:DDE-1 domain-containing protein n=1 Tax=Scylla paramamosain TaxID=85552 RepID=A0AAW0TN24_SCYPA